MKLAILASVLVATQAATTWKGWSPSMSRTVWRRYRSGRRWRWRRVTIKTLLNKCEGDCDADRDCKGTLKCLQSSDHKSILSDCNGLTHSVADYCYDPKAITTDKAKLGEHGWSAHQFQNTKAKGGRGRIGKIGLCQGDCDGDSQCRTGLKCYQSSTNGDTLTGCAGKTVGAHDYCYDPAFVTTNSKTLENHGNNAHQMGLIGMCKGDCDKDSQCAGDMKCYHSHKSGNIVTGCESKTTGRTDYCYQANRANPVHCHDWNCAEWCKYFDDTLVATYAKEGCADDGSDACACP